MRTARNIVVIALGLAIVGCAPIATETDGIMTTEHNVSDPAAADAKAAITCKEAGYQNSKLLSAEGTTRTYRCHN